MKSSNYVLIALPFVFIGLLILSFYEGYHNLSVLKDWATVGWLSLAAVLISIFLFNIFGDFK
jgi:hypothetical protein